MGVFLCLLSVFLLITGTEAIRDPCQSWTNGLTKDKVGNEVNTFPWRTCQNGSIHWRNPRDRLNLHFIDSHADFQLCLTENNNSRVITFSDNTLHHLKQLKPLSSTQQCVNAHNHTVLIVADAPLLNMVDIAVFDYRKIYPGQSPTSLPLT